MLDLVVEPTVDNALAVLLFLKAVELVIQISYILFSRQLTHEFVVFEIPLQFVSPNILCESYTKWGGLGRIFLPDKKANTRTLQKKLHSSVNYVVSKFFYPAKFLFIVLKPFDNFDTWKEFFFLGMYTFEWNSSNSG